LKQNNSLVTVIEGNIADIIRGMANYAAKGFTIDGNVVKYETSGTCIFRYGVEQKVKINESSLRSYYK
uniref:DNA-binding protein n=1 Tax=Angiostrongylus cantonensis TaxID=6313 RepID=A0A0K0DPB8_ANGCA